MASCGTVSFQTDSHRATVVTRQTAASVRFPSSLCVSHGLVFVFTGPAGRKESKIDRWMEREREREREERERGREREREAFAKEDER